LPRIIALPVAMLPFLALLAAPATAARPARQRQLSALVGRRDLTVRSPRGPYPPWLGVRRSGFETRGGSFVGEGGSARPISRVWFSDGSVRFTLPPQ
jgi:hypothetical protein